jgi:hypothetical protein
MCYHCRLGIVHHIGSDTLVDCFTALTRARARAARGAQLIAGERERATIAKPSDNDFFRKKTIDDNANQQNIRRRR